MPVASLSDADLAEVWQDIRTLRTYYPFATGN